MEKMSDGNKNSALVPKSWFSCYFRFCSKTLFFYTKYAISTLLYRGKKSELGTKQVWRRYKAGTRRSILFYFSDFGGKRLAGACFLVNQNSFLLLYPKILI